MKFTQKQIPEVIKVKKFYKGPELEVSFVSSEDIMNGSDTFIDVGHLWGEVETDA